MITFSAGQRVVAVEHDDSTRRPKQGGESYPAVVDSLAGAYVIVRYDDPDVFGGRPDQFWAESGWRAWDGLFCWRLVPAADDESAVTAGEDRSDAQ